MILSLLCASLVAATPAPTPRLAVLPFSAGEGVTETMATTLSDAMAAELRKLGTFEVMTQREISAVLSLDRQKALLGCQDTGCMAEIAGALNADQVLVGSVAKLGESWLLQVQRVDARTAATVAHSDRRTRGGVDALLDQLGALAREVAGTASAPVVAQVVPAKAVAPNENASLPPPHADVPLKDVDPSKLTVATDGGGRYLAFEPFKLTDGALLFGDAERLHAQRVFGGESEGDTQFSVVFWDPRARFPAEAGFAFRDGQYTLTCGEKQVRWTALSPAKAKAFLSKVKLFDVRWQRQAYAVARDGEGTYFFVDQARAPRGNADFRVYVGPKGKLRGYVAEALVHDSKGDVLAVGDGKLKLTRAGEAEWIVGPSRTKLTWLPVEENVRLVYGPQGPYGGLELGTPCDGRF